MPCPAGTYTERVDLIRAEDCTICPLRHACPQGTGGETQTMQDCGAGFFCPNGTAYAKQFPCLPGTWSSSTSLADSSECEICPKGKYCSGGKSFIDGSCSPGYYCPLGTAYPTKFPCPSGTYTSKTWLFESSQCDDCPPGYYCPAGSVEPIPCKPGSYTSLNSTQVVGPGLAWPACITCPAGHFCAEASIAPDPCGKGKFSSAGAKSCSVCEAGYFCNSKTTSLMNMKADTMSWLTPGSLYGKCYNGTYCPPGSDSEPALETDACPKGYYCPIATPAPVICPAGTYSNFTGQDSLDDCIPTPAGYFSLEGSLQPTVRSSSKTQIPCPSRYYINRTGGRSEEDFPEPCPIGTFSNSTSLRQVEDCILCSPGMYCDSTGLTVPRGQCDPGYYCTLGAYTSAPMNYEATIFGVNNRHTGAQCPQGAFCPLGSATPTLCPPGTYNNFTGLESESQCIPCPPGKYCETPGLFLPTGNCIAGYYCMGGASTPTQTVTEPGYYSLDGAFSQLPCPSGQFNLHTSQEKCVDCPAGFYCGFPATVNPVLCPAGNYCPENTTLPVKCPPGFFASAQGLVALDQCTPCPASYYCDSYGLSAPSGKCFEGFVCAESSPVANPVAQHFGYICPAGHYCPEGSGSEVMCPSGTFRASVGGTSVDSCTICPGGHYCSGSSLTVPSGECDEGYFCSSRASSATPSDKVTGDICPAGYFCPKASVIPLKCSAGTYTPQPGQSICAICPEGYFCDGITTNRLFDCPQGYYCPLGTAAIPIPCPVGTFNNRTKITSFYECSPSSENKFGKTALSDTHLCPHGSYCPQGTFVPLLCPRGTYSNATGLDSADGCQFCDEGNFCSEQGIIEPTGLCDAGFYCKHNNTAPNPSIGVVIEAAGSGSAGPWRLFGGNFCPQGHYCVMGSMSPRLCPEGSYANEIGMLSCKICVPGYYCPLGTVDYSANVCPQGYYCPSGTKRRVEYPCPPGSFSNRTGLQDISQCSPAPGGMYVDLYAAVQPSGACKSGFYCSGGSTSSTPSLGATGGPCLPGTNCPEGSAVPIVCDAGYYCSSTNTEKALPCTEGFYCIQGSYTATPTGQNNSLGMIGNVCSAGHYCPQGTSNPIPCPPGTFSENTQNRHVSDCFPCPASYLCSESGIVEPYEKCTPGFQLKDARKALNALKAQHNQNCVLQERLVMKKGSHSVNYARKGSTVSKALSVRNNAHEGFIALGRLPRVHRFHALLDLTVIKLVSLALVNAQNAHPGNFVLGSHLLTLLRAIAALATFVLEEQVHNNRPTV
uniref:Tyrosine-protein kinase ephrin type A/B receptor-like domain-containing protein n=1 Tax=Globisporangium ultimum (strain ATCC 200006 / CBS 805.95 / DAOM BR144) TaxID=431595 RepID=K3WJP5_GLOUD